MLNFKIRKSLFLLGFIFLIPTNLLAEKLSILSYGHSNFLLKSKEVSILLNPFKNIGCAAHLKQPKYKDFDLILASSRLADEGYNPSNSLMFAEPGIYRFKKTIFNGIPIPHDRMKGRRYGMATVWTWNQNNLKIVHMAGAAGSIQTEDEILLSRPDILFISIGGGVKSYNGLEASKVIKKLQPKIVIPVHFLKDRETIQSCDYDNEDSFLKNMKEFKIKYVGNKLDLNSNKVDEKTIIFLN